MTERFIIVTEVDDGPAFAETIFQRKFNQSPPAFPHHIVAFYRQSQGSFIPLSYLHIRPWGDFYLVGGGCTDGRVFALMSDVEREQIRATGGLLLKTLRYSFERFADRCEAYFGYCGDPRAYEVDMQAGFVPTDHEYLIARWHRTLPETRKHELTQIAHALGPF